MSKIADFFEKGELSIDGLQLAISSGNADDFIEILLRLAIENDVHHIRLFGRKIVFQVYSHNYLLLDGIDENFFQEVVNIICRRIEVVEETVQADFISGSFIFRSLCQTEELDGTIDEKEVEFDQLCRVSVIPSEDGDALMNIELKNALDFPPLDDIGLSRKKEIPLVKGIVENYQDGGIIFITGKRSSGRTTLAVSMVSCVHDAEKGKIATISLSRKKEADYPGIINLVFNPENVDMMMNRIMEARPDILLLDDMSGEECLKLAFLAVKNGCLIIATIDAENAMGVFEQLRDNGIYPSSVTSCVRGVIAIKLIAKLCQECKVKSKGSLPEDLMSRFVSNSGYRGGIVYGPSTGGCGACQGRGIEGQVPIVQILNRESIRKTVEGEFPKNSVDMVENVSFMTSIAGLLIAGHVSPAAVISALR